MESLAQLEALCERLYNSQDAVERDHAENTLKCFSVNKEYISQCQYILTNSSAPYALMLASSSLLKQVTENSLSLQLLLDIRNFLINYLATRGSDLQPFVLNSLIQLLCRVTKFGWFEDPRFKGVVSESTNFLSQATPEHYAIGLNFLNQLVSEINESNSGLPLLRQRRIVRNFRDKSLFQIFQISLTSMHQLRNDGADKLQELALSLSLKCLSFDFVGIFLSERPENISIVEIPTSWKEIIVDPSTIQIFFDYYAIGKAPLSKVTLECLVLLTSVRQSLFTTEASRSKFLAHLMTRTKEILQTGQGLTDHDNYHEFCRLLESLEMNYEISELVKVECYSDWIRLVAEFTSKSLQSWQWAGCSVYYLLKLWSKLISCLPDPKGVVRTLLDEFVPNITKGFITSRFDSVQDELSDDSSEDPLDNVFLLQDQLYCFSCLFRFQYESSSLYVVNIMEPILQIYTERSLHTGDSSAICVMEAKLAWCVHIISAVLKREQSTSTGDNSRVVNDAELAARVLQLVHVTDSGLHTQRYKEISKKRLDRAILNFFHNFCKTYLVDHTMYSSELYARLSELIGIQDHLMLLNVIVRKIITNFKCYTESDDVINYTLCLFHELASRSVTATLLLKLDDVKFIVSHNTKEHFPFLEEYKCSSIRTTFYYTIGTLIFMDGISVKFKSFMDPLLQVFISLESTPDAMFRSDAVKFSLIGLMRDIRGIAMAADNPKTYGLLFHWLYPAHLPLLFKGIAHWVDTPEVTTPILKLMAELVLNKTQRLTFGSSSPNGILLFREVSKLVVGYGSGILSLPNAADIYTFKYKGLSISFTILLRALCGEYINYSVFELYGDRALSDAIEIALKMLSSIPLADALAFRKLTSAYFEFLEVLFSHHISFILNLDATTALACIFGSLESGLKDVDLQISSLCASAFDSLATYYFNNVTCGDAPATLIALNLARQSTDYLNLFLKVLKILLELVIEDYHNHWNLSRPILSLILVNEQILSNLKAQMLASQPLDQHQRLSLCFDNLMTDITPSLDSNNRNRFTQNLVIFRRDFRPK